MFYPADWRKDPQLGACSPLARGLWAEMLFVMHECVPYGHMANNGARISDDSICRIVGWNIKSFRRALAELSSSGVFSRTKDGTIYSRRMVRDESIRAARAAGGKLGGNPALMVRDKDNLPTNLDANLKPTPSFAFAVSSSIPSLSSKQNPGIETAPQPNGEQLGKGFPKSNGKNAPRSLADILRTTWRSHQAGIAQVAAYLELAPRPGESWEQLGSRCTDEIAKRKGA